MIDISVSDLQALKPGLEDGPAQRLIDGTLARAALVAPCILTDEFAYGAAASAILVDVILRRLEVGVGSAVQTETAGPMSRTFFASSGRALFWPAEITELQALCAQSAQDQTGVASDVLPIYAMPDAPPNLFCET